MRKACVFTTEQETAWGRTINEFRLYIKRDSFSVEDLQYWLDHSSDRITERIPIGKNYMSQYVKRGFLERVGNGRYRFYENGTKPVMSHDILMCIKNAREANNAATRRWLDKKHQNKALQETSVEETPVVEILPAVYNKTEECIKYLKSLGYKIFAPRLEYDEIF